MVLRLGFLLSPRTLWVPFTILLFAVTYGRSEVSEAVNWEGDWGPKNSNGTVQRNLTGIPQIDYKTDPNLPRELNGYDLSEYPFFNKVPSNISFKCDGLKDGFYASVEHKCQLYHHCLFGTRYDFLCANYTAFDQRTFICQFVSDVDCPNSALFFHRNDELYVAKSTTTPAPVIIYRDRPAGGGGGRGRGRIRAQVALPVPKAQPATESGGTPAAVATAAEAAAAGAAPIANKPSTPAAVATESDVDDYYDDYDYVRPRRPARRRRPYRKRRPAYVDYDDYDDYYDVAPRRRARPRYNRRDDYDPDSEEDLPPRRLKKRKEKNRIKQEEVDYKDEEKSSSKSKTSTTTQKAEITPSTPSTEPPPLDPVALVKSRDELFSQSRAPPKIKPPQLAERNKSQGRPESTNSSSTTEPPSPPVTTSRPGRGRPISSSSSKSVESEQYDQYYDEEYDQPQQAPAKKSNKYLPFPTAPPTTTTTTTKKTTATTTTTTQAPLYEYEYEEYEYDQAPTTTTTTTTTTPASSSRRRNGRRQSPQLPNAKPTAQEPSIQENNISTPKAKDTQVKEALDSNSRPPALRPAFVARPRPTFFGKSSANITPYPLSTTTTTTTTERPTESPTERPTSRQNSRGRVTASTEAAQTAIPDTTTPRSRGSRFWQRPTTYSPSTAAPTTTTTQAPEQVDYVYYDESVPLTRYGQRSATTYQQYASAPDYVSDSPDPSPSPAAPPPAQTESGSQEPEIYRPNPVTTRFPLPKAIEQSNYVTPFTSQSILPAKTTAASYQLQFNHYPQAPQSRPEFISLLPEDEEDSSYYPTGGSDNGGSHSMISMISTSNNNNNNAQAQQQQQPQQPQYSPQSQVQQYQQQQPLLSQPQQQPPPPQNSRFRNQITRMFAAPQELYPVYTTPPQYIKTVRARHVFPTMFLPFANY